MKDTLIPKLEDKYTINKKFGSKSHFLVTAENELW